MMMKMSKTPQYYVPNLRPTYPEAAERDYYRLLRALVRELKKATEEHLSQIKSELRQDSTDDIIASIIAAFDKGGAKEEVIREINRIMASVDSTTKANIRKAFKATMQVDVYVDDSELLSTVQKEWYNQQSKLINSIVSTYTDKLQNIVSNAVQRGSLYKDVQQEIKKLYNTTDTRAKFIAVNEVGNLNAITTKVRQQEAGISAYRWSTSKDERVRSSHKVNEGKLFFWNSSKAGKINGMDVLPSPAFHPGMDYRCRCVAIPVIDMESWNTRMVIPLNEVKPNKAMELQNEEDSYKIKVDKDIHIYQKLDKYGDDVVNIINKADIRYRRVWGLLQKDLRIAKTDSKGTAYFSLMYRSISFNLADTAKGNSWKQPFTTYFHESGHNIDFIANELIGSGTALQPLSYTYSDNLLGETIAQEINEHLEEIAKKIKNEFKTHKGDWEYLFSKGYIDERAMLEYRSFGKFTVTPRYKKSLSYKAFSDELQAIPAKDRSCISDLAGGVTGNKVKGHIGHKTTYWANERNLSTEAFAEFWQAITNKKELKVIKKYLPRSYNVFLEILDKIIREVNL